MLRLIAILACLLLAACGGARMRVELAPTPLLQLAPASLGHALALQQRLELSVGGNRQALDALLEVDAGELRLAVQALGQSALTLRWDGRELQQDRAPWLPAQLDGARVLSDLQLVYWPVEAIRAALPADWDLVEDAQGRHLRHAQREVLVVRSLSENHVVLESVDGRYRLDIQSLALDAGTP